MDNIFPELRSRLALKRYTTKDLANLLNLGEVAIKRRLRGEKDFELSEMKTLSTELNTSMDSLFITDEEYITEYSKE